jgi:hypothetical protein
MLLAGRRSSSNRRPKRLEVRITLRRRGARLEVLENAAHRARACLLVAQPVLIRPVPRSQEGALSC